MVSLLDADAPRKPHLRLKGGVWSCASKPTVNRWRIGFGYTPMEAYEDWSRQHA